MMTDNREPSGNRPDDAGTPRRLLIIDDEQYLRDMLAHILPSYGLEVTTCGNAVEALHQPRLHEFQYILTDRNMPGMNGIDLTRLLRENLPSTVIIGMSGTDENVDFLLAGANDFLLKPFETKHLAMMINGLVCSGLNC
jgi:DNA-binding response OmpR family regulator